MTIKETLICGANRLSSVENGSNEAKFLLEKVLNCDGSRIYLHPEYELSPKENEEYVCCLTRRLSGEPIQYILGEWDFYGNTFSVGPGVLIPRPDTEVLIDTVLSKYDANDKIVIFDLCAGTGCIGLTLAEHLPGSQVFLAEKYDNALWYLNKNVTEFGLPNVTVVKGDIFRADNFENLPLPDVIVSNPPYIASREIPQLQSEVLNEPVTALDGGTDGLDFYRAIKENFTVKSGGYFCFECGEGQAEQISGIFSDSEYTVTIKKDYFGADRCVFIEVHK